MISCLLLYLRYTAGVPGTAAAASCAASAAAKAAAAALHILPDLSHRQNKCGADQEDQENIPSVHRKLLKAMIWAGLSASRRHSGQPSRTRVQLIPDDLPASAHPQCHSDQSDQQGGGPGDGALPDNQQESGPHAQLPLNGSDGCHAGRVKQTEHQKRRGRE